MAKLLIITPFYNVDYLLEQAIESILQQTYKNIQLVLINDGSTDNSYEVAKKYEDRSNVTVIDNNDNQGPYNRINQALELYKDKEWDLVHFHDADDVSDLTRFEKIIQFFDQNPKMLACKTTFVRVHYPSNEIAYENGRQHITTSEGIAFYRRKVFEEIGYFDKTVYSGDTEYYWRLQAWINHNKLDYYLGEHKDVLYIAYLRGNNNLTVSIPIQNRAPYYNRIFKDIQFMAQTGNFKRTL
jgi:glycosyltransferase involved in cell wall biosynthesis